MVETKIPPVTVFFFVLAPTLALASAVAVLASPEPRSWSFFAAVVSTWIGLRGAAWFMYKNRDDVLKLEKITCVNEASILRSQSGRFSVVDDDEEKTDEEGIPEQYCEQQPQSVYHHKHLYKILQGLMRPPMLTVQIQHASVVSLIIVLAIRMFHIELFGTHPANVDFGSDGNIAFVHKFDSFCRVLEGGIAAFLSYPAVAGLIARVFTTAAGDSLLLKKPNVYFLWLCEIISAGMTLFPSVMILSAIAQNYNGFSNSTHLRKLTEWIIGYSLGTASGIYFSCIVSRVLFLISGILNTLENHDVNADEAIAYVVDKLVITRVTGEVSVVGGENESSSGSDNGEVMNKYGFGKTDEYKGHVMKLFELTARLIAMSCQLLFALATVLNAISLGATWYYDREEKLSVTILCVLLGCVVFTFVAIAFATRKIYH